MNSRDISLQFIPRNIFNPAEWFSDLPRDLFMGALIALTLIPQSIAFSIIAGVDPKVGLYASFCIILVTSVLGGRSVMVSAATGAMALVMTPLVKAHGFDYLLATTILTGFFQILWGFLKLARQMRFVSRAVMAGFNNALAIMIFRAQFPHFTGENGKISIWLMLAGGLAIIYGLPRLTRRMPRLSIVPSPLIAIALITSIAVSLGVTVPTVGDIGVLPQSLPQLIFPQVPLNFETLVIITPYALALSFIGLLESFLAATAIDEYTDTQSDRHQEAKGQGIANIVAGLLGGMAGCAMIGLSSVNVQMGSRTRLSTFSAGFFLLLFVFLLGDWVSKIPMGVLVAVMVMVAASTFNWSSVRRLRRIPLNETGVMIATVIATLLTNNLAIGVLCGVAFNGLLFAQSLAGLLQVETELEAETEVRIYRVSGQLFFLSADRFLDSFNFQDSLKQVVIDLSHTNIWDQSAVTRIHQLLHRFEQQGVEVELVGLTSSSSSLLTSVRGKARGEQNQG